MSPLNTYDYLIKSRALVFAAVRPLTPAQYHQPFAYGLKTIAATITHLMISEWYYIERLAGRDVPPYEEWSIHYASPPEFEVVQANWSHQSRRTRAMIAGEADWNRVISWSSFPDEQGRRCQISTTAGEIVTQLVLHEVHHRAQLMSMLRGLTPPVPPLEDLDYGTLMYDRREVGRK